MKVLRQDTEWLQIFKMGVPLTGIAFILILFLFEFLFSILYQDKIIEGVWVDGTNISGLTQAQSMQKLEQRLKIPEYTVTLMVDDISIASSSGQLGLHKDYQQTIEQAYDLGRSNSLFSRSITRLVSIWTPIYFFTDWQFDASNSAQMISELNKLVEIQGKPATATLTKTGDSNSLLIFPGSIGRVVDAEKTLERVQLATDPEQPKVDAVVASTSAVLTDEQFAQAKQQSRNFVGKKLILKNDTRTITWNDTQLIKMLAFPEGFNSTELQTQLVSVQKAIDRSPQDAIFEYDPQTLKVTSFIPHRLGYAVDLFRLEQDLTTAFDTLHNSSEGSLELSISVASLEPQNTLGSLNDLGIKEQIGFGESKYDHSIPTRIHNVSNANRIINNRILPPGKEFSFNKELGEVSRRTGYQPAYVISQGRTILGDGGGVCQVSTTLFRALLDAGLDITKRKAHSYRVSYYELNQDPGFDATVYAGDVDLRFINNTDHHILLHFQDDPKNTYMSVEIYGTSDGRTTEIVDYQKWGQTGPLATQYIDDPTLPAGKLVQIDWAVGGIRTKFTHVVRDKDGNVMSEKEYASNYIPWSAKYRRGTGT